MQTAPIVPFPATVITYLAPPSKSPDIPVLRIADTILSGGESSRLYQELVRNQKIAQEADFSADIRVDRGLLYFFGIASEGHTSEQLEKGFLAELKKMQETAVSAKELEKAKNQLIAQTLRSRETNDGKAIAIERAIAYQGDPLAINTEVQRLQAVTAADIQRVMKKYLTDKNRVVIYYNQAKEGKESE
jgi:zinc protease